MNKPRRRFLSDVGTGALATSIGLCLDYAALADDPEIRVGYYVSTWSGKLEQALDDLAETGWRGVQLSASDYARFADRPAECKQLLAARKLTPVALSTGQVTIQSSTEKQELTERVAMARWLKEVGGLYLLATDGARVAQGINDLDDYKRLGKRLNEIGKRTLGECGIKLGYQNAINTLGEAHGDVDRIMNATDGKTVWLAPDIAELKATGGDPVRFVSVYATRIICPHFKDVVIQKSGPVGLDGRAARPKYNFVELGQGQVDLPGVLRILRDYRFSGWIIVELDAPVGGRTPKESALLSKRYVEERLKMKVW